MFQIFDDENDVIRDQIATISSGMWSEGVGNFQDTTGGGAHTSSVQSASNGDYFVEVYNKPLTDTTSERQFAIAYGHKGGSGSLGTIGATGDRVTAAIYGQFNNLINPPETETFSFKGNTKAQNDIYVITINRARLREKMDPGNWELRLGASGSAAQPAGGKLLQLIDDSSTNTNPNSGELGVEFNIVSGSVAGGSTSIDTAADSETTHGSYGFFYPEVGILILNPSALSGSHYHLNTVSASNTANNNHITMFNAVSSSGAYTDGTTGIYFDARREEKVTSNHYFIRVKNKDFNFSQNPTYVSGSDGSLKIDAFKGNSKTFITTVGLYGEQNDDLLAVAKLSKPILKDKTREALIKVKLDF